MEQSFVHVRRVVNTDTMDDNDEVYAEVGAHIQLNTQDDACTALTCHSTRRTFLAYN